MRPLESGCGQNRAVRVQNNNQGAPMTATTTAADTYTFTTTYGETISRPIWLTWEAEYSSYPFDMGMAGAAAWRAWREEMAGDTVPIWWFVEGPGICESAPFSRGDEYGGTNFLEFFGWPEDPNGDPINWAALPVKDGKSDWIVDYTGWRPAPFTPEIPALAIARAMGLR
jgi:hypothetical protein